jgi:hypothetical protein
VLLTLPLKPSTETSLKNPRTDRVYESILHVPTSATTSHMSPAAYSLSEASNEKSIQSFPSIKVAAMPRTSQPTMTIPLGALIHCIVECAGLFCSLKPFVFSAHLRGAAGFLGWVLQQTPSRQLFTCVILHTKEISAHVLSPGVGLVSRVNEFESQLQPLLMSKTVTPSSQKP